MSLILNDEITSIREEIDDKEKESGDEMKSVKKKGKNKNRRWMRERVEWEHVILTGVKKDYKIYVSTK